MARKKPDLSGGGPNWLDTYADMVTLLLTFFVLLFAMSTMDASKWQALVKAFSRPAPSGQTQQIVISPESMDPAELSSAPIAASGSGTGGLDDEKVTEVLDFDDLYQYLKQYVQEKGLNDAVGLYRGDGYTFITFQNNIFFDGNSSVLREDGKQILDYLCGGLTNISDDIGEIRVFGHTANAGSMSTAQARIADRQLSGERANSVLMYIDLKDIIAPRKMVSEGYGEYRPLIPHDGTEATRIKNRRVELYISKTNTMSATLDDIYREIQKADADQSG